MQINKKKAKDLFNVSIIMVLSSICRAVAVYMFIQPNNFAPGGVTGIATMIQFKTGLSSGYFIFLFNVPLLILSWIFINRNFAIKTGITILMVSALIILLEQLNLYMYMPQNEKLLPAIAGGIFSGAGLALMLKIGGSTGGSDIVAMLIMKKFSATNVTWIIFALDAAVITTSFFVFNQGLDPVMLALAEIFVGTKVAEAITHGFKSAVKFEIITSEPTELSKEILSKLERGVTSIKAEGMYTNTEKHMLICVVRKGQVAALRKILSESGKGSFAMITPTTEVLGIGFSSAH